MDLVLGLSMTSTAGRWVLVAGTTGEGAPIDRGVFDIAEIAAFDADDLLDVLLKDETVAESGVHAIGVTWTSEAEAAASSLLGALKDRGLGAVVAVSETEAAEALASGIADIAGYDDVAVCVVEPDAAVVAVANAEGVTVDRIDRPLDQEDAIELTSTVMAALDIDDGRPDAIFVVGSGELDPIVSSLAATSAPPVITAAEGDMALARGAALASALAVNTVESQVAPVTPRWMSSNRALTPVLVAAVVTFVVSLSIALGLRLTPDTGSQQARVADTADELAGGARPPAVAQSVPEPPGPGSAPPPPAGRPPLDWGPVAQTLIVAAPPVPEFVPAAPAAPAPLVPPAPLAPPAASVYVPPPPAYVPPPAAPPKPRLRDRIIERIPIINRFHEPQYPYP